MKFKMSCILLSVLVMGNLVLLGGNARWKGDNITIKSLSSSVPGFYENHQIQFEAVLQIRDGDMQNLRITAGIDDKVMFDTGIKYYFQNNIDYTYKFTWSKATAGDHTVFFKVEDKDSYFKDSNPNDNIVRKNFTVSPGLKSTAPTANTSGLQIQKGKYEGKFKSSTQLSSQLTQEPCTQYQNERTDLMITSFVMMKTPRTGRWAYLADVKNDGRRCVKMVGYSISNGNDTLVEKSIGDSKSPTYILPAQGKTKIRGMFDHPGNFVTFLKDGERYAKFTLILDPDQLIPDPDRINNKKETELKLNN